ncbi:MAG: excalibur calcium-binding domain-containing protein [Actinomycetota bacterium]|nr:excalibur calcium-binding domain-containing protein [Actinomycetota bacterium]
MRALVATASLKPSPKPVATTSPRPRVTATRSQAPTAKVYANCTAMRQDYPHGVGRPGAVDQTSGKPVTNFYVNKDLYNANTKSDRDKDGIACEAA